MVSYGDHIINIINIINVPQSYGSGREKNAFFVWLPLLYLYTAGNEFWKVWERKNKVAQSS